MGNDPGAKGGNPPACSPKDWRIERRIARPPSYGDAGLARHARHFPVSGWHPIRLSWLQKLTAKWKTRA